MKKYFVVFLSVIMASALFLSACTESKPETLEEVVAVNEDVAEEIKTGAEESDIQIDIKDNTVTYSYDISSVEGVTDEMMESDDFIKSFETSLESQGQAFADVCSSLEEKTGLEGVSVKVVYLYKDKEITSATYTSDYTAPEEPSDDEDEGSEESES